MVENKKVKYILHVSDFHLNADNLDFAKSGLKCLSKTLDDNDITIDYLIHTGDVIDAKNAYKLAAIDLAEEDSKYAWINEECITDSRFDEKKVQK